MCGRGSRCGFAEHPLEVRQHHLAEPAQQLLVDLLALAHDVEHVCAGDDDGAGGREELVAITIGPHDQEGFGQVLRHTLVTFAVQVAQLRDADDGLAQLDRPRDLPPHEHQLVDRPVNQ